METKVMRKDRRDGNRKGPHGGDLYVIDDGREDGWADIQLEVMPITKIVIVETPNSTFIEYVTLNRGRSPMAEMGEDGVLVLSIPRGWECRVQRRFPMKAVDGYDNGNDNDNGNRKG